MLVVLIKICCLKTELINCFLKNHQCVLVYKIIVLMRFLVFPADNFQIKNGQPILRCPFGFDQSYVELHCFDGR